MSSVFEDAEGEGNSLKIPRRSERIKSCPDRYDEYKQRNDISVNMCRTDVRRTFEEAIESSESQNWTQAMNKEIESLKLNKTFKHESDFHEVPLACIKQKKSDENALERFNPKNYDDFDKTSYYFIKWLCEDYECEKVKIKPIHKHYYRIQVLLLAGSWKLDTLKVLVYVAATAAVAAASSKSRHVRRRMRARETDSGAAADRPARNRSRQIISSTQQVQTCNSQQPVFCTERFSRLSPEKYENSRHAARYSKIKYKKPLSDSKTRWNSTFDMLYAAHAMKDALDQAGQSNTAPIQRQRKAVVLRRGHPLVSGVLQQLCIVRAVPRDEDVVTGRQLAIERVKSFIHRLASETGSVYTNSSCKSLRTWPYLPLPVPCPLPWRRKIARRDVNKEPEPEASLAIAPLPLQPTTSPNLAHLTVTPPLSSDARTCQRQHQLTKVTVPPVKPPQWEVTIAKKAAQNALPRPTNTLDEYIAAHPRNLLLPKPAISLCQAQRAPKPRAEPCSPRNPRDSPSRRPSARRKAELRRSRCRNETASPEIDHSTAWRYARRTRSAGCWWQPMGSSAPENHYI
ncbi:unnamed protein product [Trichogramma brassicae]|uniref:Uncharacterized protein n=1 Tax=Trichogramma brassicae TaxID=86971 RepID=A0A6H5J1K6_9HYME|nr:unnamed protein product [Trichogramma brassicae]